MVLHTYNVVIRVKGSNLDVMGRNRVDLHATSWTSILKP